jgi:uncharacterized protein YggE
MREVTVPPIAAQIRGPWWRIPPDDPARLEACRRAAEDARTRAEAYADALGTAVSGLITVVDARAHVPGSGGAVGLAASSGAQDLEVSSGELTVTAAVEVTFELVEA